MGDFGSNCSRRRNAPMTCARPTFARETAVRNTPLTPFFGLPTRQKGGVAPHFGATFRINPALREGDRGGAFRDNGGEPILTGASPCPIASSLRSEEHTSELQSLMRNSYAVFCL